MTRDDIIRMARNEYDIYAFTAESLAEFATLVAAAEREACAKVCEARKIIEPDYEDQRHYNQGIEHCATAIRARGET